MASYEVPLSSDMFSTFGGVDNLRTHNKEGVRATAHLLDVVVPRLAQRLDKNVDSLQLEQLTERMHRAGVNMRYLGQLVKHAHETRVRMLLTLEALARAAKNVLRARWRSTSGARRSLGDGAFVDIALELFNLLVRPPAASDAAASAFWAQLSAALADSFDFGAPPTPLASVARSLTTSPRAVSSRTVALGAASSSAPQTPSPERS